jgi:hypothetical protein
MTGTPAETATHALIRRAIGDPGSITPRGGYLGQESLTEWQARAVELTAAPAIAAAERERWTAALSHVHAEFGIYDECDHNHTDEEVAQGLAVDTDDFRSCKEAELCAICAACCTEAECQTETCANYHDHRPGKPICPTAALIASLRTTEGTT